MVVAPQGDWLPLSIILAWAGKCLAEMVLCYMALKHQVRYVWAMAFYTFWTTLGLMLMVQAQSHFYPLADRVVAMGGGAVMLGVAVGLVMLLAKGQREYGRITLAYILLCASQVVVSQIRAYVHQPELYNIIALTSWPVMVLWLAWECHRIPRSRLKAVDVYLLMMRDVLG